MSIQDVLTFVGLVITVLGLIGGSFALVKGSYNKARIQALREDNDDLRKRLDDADKDSIRRDAREQTLIARIEHVESENELLKTMVTQRANVDQVLDRLNEHHEQVMIGQTKLAQALMAAQERLLSVLERITDHGA